MKIQAVLFDLDDTLIVDEAVSTETFAAVAKIANKSYGAEPAKFARDAAANARQLWASGPANAYCRAIGISAFECLWGMFEGESEDLTTLREWAHVYRDQVFDKALRAQMIEAPEGGAKLAEAFETERRRLLRLMPDAKEILTRLSKDYKLGMLTNGAPDLQREKIAASGLGSLFQAIAVSGEVGIGKPLPGVFHHLLAELGVPASAAVMVGNSKERDIAGARNAGVFSVWIKVPGSEEPEAVEPDATIHSLAELPAVLDKVQSAEPA